MSILTVDQLREHIETDLGDDALQRLADGAEGTIIASVGSLTARVDVLEGLDRAIYATASVSSVTSIKERDFDSDDQVTLSTDDWRREYGKRFIRLQDGSNSRFEWARHVELTYVPDIDTGILQTVQIALVKLGVVYSGAERETDGEFEFSHPDNAAAVKAAMFPLMNSRTRMLIR